MTMMRIKKITEVAFMITDIIALCFFVPLFIYSLFAYRTIDFETMRETTSETLTNPVISLLFALVLPVILYIAIYLFTGFDAGRRWMFACIVIGICIVFILLLGHWWIVSNPFEPVADQEQVWRAAVDIAYGNGGVNTDLIYFQEYPQQKPMAVIMSIAAKALSADLIAYEHMNLLFIAATVLMMAICVKESTGRPGMTALVSLMLTAFTPFTLYSKFIYGSVPAIFFTVISCYGMLRYFKGRSVGWLLLPVLFTPLAVMLYQSELIFLIAAVIVIIMGSITTYIDKKRLLGCVLTVCLMILLTVSMSWGTERVFKMSLGTTEEGGDGIPPSGHMLMGLMAVDDNMPGNYNGESQRIYEGLGYDTKAADLRSKQMIAEALKGFANGERSLKFFLVKTECQGLDPWFGGMTMNVYDAEYRGSYKDDDWDSFLFGRIPKVMQGYLRILMITIYEGAIACMLFRIIRGCGSNPAVYLPSIYFIGGFIFQFFWEQKSRYCLPYYIALFPLAAYGLACASCTCNREASLWSRRKKIYVLVGTAGCLLLLLMASLSTAHDFSPELFITDGSDMLRTEDMQLPKGDYGIVLRYDSDEDMEMQLYLDRGGTGYPVNLAKELTEMEIPAYMDGYKDKVHFELEADKGDNLIIKNIHVYSSGLFYLDYVYMAVIFIAGTLLLYRIFEPSTFALRDPKERRLIKILTEVSLLTIPISVIIGQVAHIPIICRFFRVSAWFSVFTALLALYVALAFAIYKKMHRLYSNDDTL